MSGSVLNTVGRMVYQLGFEISPILLKGGIAAQMPGGYLPIVALTEGPNFVDGLLSGSQVGLDQFFAHFRPLPGTQLGANELGAYPFANMVVAANAILRQPLTIALAMSCPAKNDFGYLAKLGIMTTLKSVIDSHEAQGGTYVVVTPSQIYMNCVRVGLTDISEGEDAQPQTIWRWDFVQPLLTIADAQTVLNTLTQKLNSELPNDGTLSGPNVSVGSQLSGAGSSTIPALNNLTGVISTAPVAPVSSSPL